MRPDALDEAVRQDIALGKRPCAIVATTGTTTSTAIDPLEEIAGVARSHGLWLHVDAAMAGSAMILPECRWMWKGVEGADSLVLNAHKWLGAAFDCSLYYVKDQEHLVRVMSTNPSYLQSAADETGQELPRLGHPAGPPVPRPQALVPGSCRGSQRACRPDCAGTSRTPAGLPIRCARRLDWRVLAPVPLQTLCIRHEPPGLEAETLDVHTTRLGRSGQSIGKRLPDPGNPGRTVDGPDLDRRRARRNAVTSRHSGDSIRQEAESDMAWESPSVPEVGVPSAIGLSTRHGLPFLGATDRVTTSLAAAQRALRHDRRFPSSGDFTMHGRFVACSWSSVFSSAFRPPLRADDKGCCADEELHASTAGDPDRRGCLRTRQRDGFRGHPPLLRPAGPEASITSSIPTTTRWSMRSRRSRSISPGTLRWPTPSIIARPATPARPSSCATSTATSARSSSCVRIRRFAPSMT